MKCFSDQDLGSVSPGIRAVHVPIRLWDLCLKPPEAEGQLGSMVWGGWREGGGGYEDAELCGVVLELFPL